jgi:hypothetical protein
MSSHSDRDREDQCCDDERQRPSDAQQQTATEQRQARPESSGKRLRALRSSTYLVLVDEIGVHRPVGLIRHEVEAEEQRRHQRDRSKRADEADQRDRDRGRDGSCDYERQTSSDAAANAV